MNAGWYLSMLGAFSLVLYSRQGGLPRRRPHFHYSNSGEFAASWDRSQIPLVNRIRGLLENKEVGLISDIKWG